MLDSEQRLMLAVSLGGVALLMFGIFIGRATAPTSAIPNAQTAGQVSSDGTSQPGESQADAISSSTSTPSGDTTTTTIAAIDGDASQVLESEGVVLLSDAPNFGTQTQRSEFISDLVAAGMTGGTEDGLLATADHVCYTLGRMQAQHRSPAFAVRVIWNVSLADLASEDVAAFASVFNAAPHYLCPESLEYAESVAYWLGY